MYMAFSIDVKGGDKWKIKICEKHSKIIKIEGKESHDKVWK
jgi:hypothetical protein